MKYTNLETDNQQIQVADSEEDSDLTLVIVPGFEGANAWKHQYRYFKSEFRTIVIKPKSREKESYVESVKTVLEKKNLTNCITAGANLSCFVIDQVKESDRIISTVYTDSGQSSFEISRNLFTVIRNISRHPKILKKLAFSEKTDYGTVKEFRQELDWMDWDEITSYSGSEIRGNAANALLIEPENSVFATDSIRDILDPDLSVSNITSGSFCFYEKPEEYNKALYDFIARMRDYREKAQVREKRETNRALTDFEDSRKKRKVKRK